MMSGIERDWATRADYGWRGSAARTASKPEFGFQGEAAVDDAELRISDAVNPILLAYEFRANANFAAVVVSYSTLGSMFTRGCLASRLQHVVSADGIYPEYRFVRHHTWAGNRLQVNDCVDSATMLEVHCGWELADLSYVLQVDLVKRAPTLLGCHDVCVEDVVTVLD